jgi:hypothetical protein
MIAPQVPTGLAVGQAIFNHHTHGQVDHSVRVVTAGMVGTRSIKVITCPVYIESRNSATVSLFHEISPNSKVSGLPWRDENAF